MDAQTLITLCKLTDEFYRCQSESFSDTRRGPWRGWRRCLEAMEKMPESVSLLDLACGNLRFESFLVREFPQCIFDFHVVDNCPDLVASGKTGLKPAVAAAEACAEGELGLAADASASSHTSVTVDFQELDVMNALLSGKDLAEELTAPPCDIAVSFGFMHHVPGERNRERVLSALLDKVKPGGFVMVSFWQFMNSPTLAERARETTAAGLEKWGLPALDADDYLVGWQDAPGVYRYCHSFDERQIDALLASVAARTMPVARFEADGRTGDLNAYAVLKVSV